MSIHHLESKISELSAQVTKQDAQIAELKKQLTGMQAAMSCDINALSSRITVIESLSR